MSNVPTGWQASCLSDLASAVGGGTPSKSEPRYWANGSIPWVSPKDMKTRLVIDSEDHVTEAALDRLSVVPPDSVLVVVRSGILSRTLPVAQTKVPITVNQDMRAFVPHAGISSSFLAWQLISKEREILQACSKDGTTVASIEGPALAGFPLLIAPAAEQTRIVAKLEELLSDLDAGVAELKAAQQKLARYRQSLLKAAVEGALTAEWRASHPPAETGVQLLERILTERRTRWEARQLAKFQEQGKTPPKDWQKKYPEPVPPDTRDLPELPKGWVWASVDQLSPDDLANGRSVPTADNGAKVLRLTSVRDGLIDLTASKCGAWTDDEARPFWVAEDDLLIVRGNGSLSLVGRAGLVPAVDEPVAYPDTLIRLRVLSSVVRPAWVAAMWNSALVRNHIEGRARTSAGIYKISQPDIVTTAIPVPPLAEQSAALAVLDALKTEVAGTASAIEHSLKQSAAQRQNILRAAFSGQLVPQEPSDEPASVLLERIRAGREALARARKPRGRRVTEVGT